MGAAHATRSASERAEQKRRLLLALGVTLSFFVVELVGGFLSGSLALLADAAHLFTDAGALLLAYTAMTLADRRPTSRHTFGLYRAEVLAAFVNAEILLVVCGFLFWEAWHRLQAPPAIDTVLMCWVAAAGLAANLIALRLLHRDHEKSLNLNAAYLEVLTDSLASVAVLVAGLVMRPTGWYVLDPLVTTAIAFLVLPRTISLLRQSAHILLEGTPGEVDLTELRRQLLEIPGVEELHDLHLWTLTSGLHSLSVHIRATPESPRGEVLKEVQRVLREDAGVEHATVQVEWGSEVVCEVTHHA